MSNKHGTLKKSAFDSGKFAANQSIDHSCHPLVVVVDDDATARQLAQDILEASGFNITLAEDGIQALSLVKQNPPDVILMDVEMPRMDGFTTCQKLHELPVIMDIPVIMVTGKDDNEATRRAFEVQATDFVTKPVNWAVLIQRIRHTLRASATLSELKKSEMRLENAQRVAKLGYWDWDILNDSVYISDQLREVYGHPGKALNSAESFFEGNYQRT